MIKNAERYAIIYLVTFFHLIFLHEVNCDELQVFSFSFSSFFLIFHDLQLILLAFQAQLPWLIYALLEVSHLVSEFVIVLIYTFVRTPILLDFS